ncbi:pilus assembly protein Flp/PilA [Tissierella praeacuta DSM 18095]|uniref:Pilus assembly protein Flp/PilA n=1 Tax=Tissierella praeacuta DSM 18095 TaxID=1123404 RepID=A0A1M4XJ55_9FIRM|nr:Flp family type IVb pilin [Tissierella praeacuta]SHE93353.1 pilus assembly protein Flp/PilA [Tissierella praeacuta DSM 18095]SUP02084.1 Flp pilus assembly protein, pilin Flp [Tissierella praeacuta]
MKWLMNEESGQGMVEYGLILVLVSVVAIVALGAVGGKLKEIFEGLTEKLKPST